MSVPLDRLYHYLESLCNEDIIIYRWHPNGSKKLTDLTIFNPDKMPNGCLEQYCMMNLIFHDQEPLYYNHYSHDDFVKVIERHQISKRNSNRVFSWLDSEEFVNLLATSHLRTMLFAPINFYDSVLLCHSEQNSKELEIYEQNGFIGVYYWAHALISRDWFRFAKHDLTLGVEPKNIKYDFLIYNRAWSGTREYRLKFAELIVENKLTKNCNTKFNPVDDNQHYKNFKFKNPALSINRYDLETFFELNNTTSSASADYNNNDYTSSAIEIVLETLFDDSRWHLTEKSLRPIACGKPFILMATPGSLKYLRSYGFKTFDGLINEDYDNITDSTARIQFIINEMKRISLMGEEEKYSFWHQLNTIADYNKKHFFSQEFQQQVVNEFVENLNESIEKCKLTMSGKWYKIQSSYFDCSSTEVGAMIDNYLKKINLL